MYLTPQLSWQLSDAGQEPSLFPREISWCSTAAVCGRFIAKGTFNARRGTSLFYLTKNLGYLVQVLRLLGRTEQVHRAEGKACSHCLLIWINSATLAFKLSLFCFKRIWGSGVSLCTESAQKRICFLLPFILWTALHFEVFFSSIRKQTPCRYVRTSEF